jgi:2-oxoglutarate ferredoxin oxidoreductase subunit beta
LRRAAAHKGSAFVEIYQNCHVYNDGTFEYAKDKKTRDDHVIELEHGRPMVFGVNRDKGLRLNGFRLEVAQLGNGVTEADLAHHDEHAESSALAHMLAEMEHPHMPEAMGVLRDLERPTQNELMAPGDGREPDADRQDLVELLRGKDSWVVE